jgi:hypothetical protein
MIRTFIIVVTILAVIKDEVERTARLRDELRHGHGFLGDQQGAAIADPCHQHPVIRAVDDTIGIAHEVAQTSQGI